MAPGDRPDLDRLHAEIDALGAAIGDVAIETFNHDTLTVASRAATRIAAMVDGFRADLARKERDLRPPGPKPPRDHLDPNGQRPSGKSGKDNDRANLFDNLPDLGDATRRGDLPGEYADAINTAVASLSSDEREGFLNLHRDALCTCAVTMRLHEFTVHVRQMVEDFCRANELERFQGLRRRRSGKLWNDHVDGMTKLFAQFDPETGARVKQAIDQEVDRLYRAKRDDPNDTRTHQQLVADAIANLICGARAKGAGGTDLVVLVDLQTLLDADTVDTTAATAGADTAAATNGAAAGADTQTDAATSEPANPGRCCETSDGTPLPVETVRHLACNAGIIPAVLNGNGVVLDLGRSQRLASAAQRAALRVMYPTCAFNGCTVPYDRCEIHHIDPFGPPTNGPTDLDKLVPGCNRHHHKIHDEHLQLSIDPATRTMTVTYPDGTQVLHPLPKRRRSSDPHRAAS